MKRGLIGLFYLALASTLIGCASSPTEVAFGDAVRATLAEQRAYPAPVEDADEPGMDGPRAEGVMNTYRGVIGSPTNVVGGQAVERE